MRNATSESRAPDGTTTIRAARTIAGPCVAWLSSLLALGCQGDRAHGVQGARPAVTATSSASALSAPASTQGDEIRPSLAALSPEKSKTERAAKSLPPLRSEQKGFVVLAPGDCFADGAPYDLVVHFHGLADVVAGERDEAELDGVLAVANAGAWSRDYRREYGRPGTLDAVLERVDGELDRLCPGKKRELRRLALSGWSAGYSVIRHVLRDSGPERVDAVLLSDGIHASLAPSDADRRGVLSTDVDSFVRFGKLALEGKKLFSITHSSIQTPDYASTTETTNYLLSQLGLGRTLLGAASSEPSRDPGRPTSEVVRGGLHVRGYAGPTAPDHVWQIRSMGPTLFSDLKTWWAK